MAPQKPLPSPADLRAVCTVGAPVLGLTASGGRLAASVMGVSGGYLTGSQISLWDAASGALVRRVGADEGGVCWQAAVSPDGGLVAAGFGDCTFRVWEVATGVERLRVRLGGIVASVTWSDDGRFVFTGNCGDKTVRLWDVAAGAVVAQHKSPRSIMWFTAMAGDLRGAASGNADKAVHLWDPRTCAPKGSLEGHAGKILALAYARDGALLASASQDKTARVWDPASSRCVAVLAGHTKPVTAVCFSDSGDVVTASPDGTVRVWRAPTYEDVRVWSLGATHACGVASLGAEVFLGCDDGVVRAATL